MREEQPMDYAVALSKTYYAAFVQLGAALEDLKREIISALYPWRKR